MAEKSDDKLKKKLTIAIVAVIVVLAVLVITMVVISNVVSSPTKYSESEIEELMVFLDNTAWNVETKTNTLLSSLFGISSTTKLSVIRSNGGVMLIFENSRMSETTICYPSDGVFSGKIHGTEYTLFIEDYPDEPVLFMERTEDGERVSFSYGGKES